MNTQRSISWLCTSAALLFGASSASAQVGIDWSTIDCGGGTSTGGTLSISGTIGQPDAAAPPLTGGTLSLVGGFWAGTGSGRPPCPVDFNHDGDLNPDDLGDFITCYFTEPPCPGANFNGDGDINPDDLGDYITAYFQGC